MLNWQANADVFAVSTLEPRLASVGFECNASTQLVSRWSIAAGCNLSDARWDPVALRGGGALRVDPQLQGWIDITTDPRTPVPRALERQR